MSRATGTRRAAVQGGAVGALLGDPLTFDVECLTSRAARRGASHPVTLHPDGSLETPHDLAAERVAVAFGGYCSCLELAEAAPAILADAVGLLSRRTRPALRRRADGRWAIPRCAGCSCPASFRSASDAAAHARGARHLAARHGSREAMVRRILDGLEQVLPGPPRDSDDLAVLVREPGGPGRLWAAGLHPDDARAWSRLAAGVTEPLPTAYFLGLAYGAPDKSYLGAALPGRPDGDTAAWLAWLGPVVGRGEDCRVLLAAGLPRQDVLSLLASGLGQDRLTALAAESGLPAEAVARQLAAWARADCWPDGVHVRILASHGLAAHRPSAALLDRLVDDAAGLAAPPSRTELGVMAALVGGRAGVMEALSGGARSALELIDRMEEK